MPRPYSQYQTLVDSRREFEAKMQQEAIARQLELIENEDVRLKDMLALS